MTKERNRRWVREPKTLKECWTWLLLADDKKMITYKEWELLSDEFLPLADRPTVHCAAGKSILETLTSMFQTQFHNEHYQTWVHRSIVNIKANLLKQLCNPNFTKHQGFCQYVQMLYKKSHKILLKIRMNHCQDQYKFQYLHQLFSKLDIKSDDDDDECHLFFFKIWIAHYQDWFYVQQTHKPISEWQCLLNQAKTRVRYKIEEGMNTTLNSELGDFFALEILQHESYPDTKSWPPLSLRLDPFSSHHDDRISWASNLIDIKYIEEGIWIHVEQKRRMDWNNIIQLFLKNINDLSLTVISFLFFPKHHNESITFSFI